MNERQERELVSIVKQSDSYRAMALRGEPCNAFPGLTVDATDADIGAAVRTAFEEARLTMPPVKNEAAVRRIVEKVCEVYARAYVAGLREVKNVR